MTLALRNLVAGGPLWLSAVVLEELYAGRADGSFSSPVAYDLGPTAGGASEMASIADFDGDGLLDIAATGYYSADMFIQILKKVGPNLTPEAFQQAAANFTYSIPNVVGPTYYPAGFQTGPPCGIGFSVGYAVFATG